MRRLSARSFDMASPFRDDVTAARGELMVLEYEQWELRTRITELRRRIDRSARGRGIKIATLGGIAFACFGIVVIVAWWVALMSVSRIRPKNEPAFLGAKRIAAAAEVTFNTSCCFDDPPCPSVEDLVKMKKIEPKWTDDPWGRPYQIGCSSDDTVWVYSLGKDGIAHTADDVASDMPESNLETLDGLAK